MRSIVGALAPVFGAQSIVGQQGWGGCFPQSGPGALLTPDQQQAALAQMLAANGMAVYDACPTKGRVQLLGFNQPTVSAANPFVAGTTINMIATPQQLFKPKRFYVPSDYAGAVVINQITIGNLNQLVGTGPLSGRMFTEFSTDPGLDFDTAQVSQQITVNVTNISGSDLTSFVPSFKGLAVY